MKTLLIHENRVMGIIERLNESGVNFIMPCSQAENKKEQKSKLIYL